MQIKTSLKEATEIFKQLMQGYPARWCVAGGWAIDLFLKEKTREHEDLEVVVFRSDLALLYEQIFSYHPQKILTGKETLFIDWKGESLPDEVVQLRVKLSSLNSVPLDFDFLITPATEQEWICRRDTRIRLPFSKVILLDRQVPYLAPEIVLLFKAKYCREKDKMDFQKVCKVLNEQSRSWLKFNLSEIHPDHRWIHILQNL